MPSVNIDDRHFLSIHILETDGRSIARGMQWLGRARLRGDSKTDGMKVVSQHLTEPDMNSMSRCGYSYHALMVIRNTFTWLKSQVRAQKNLRAYEFPVGGTHFLTRPRRTSVDVRRNADLFDNHTRSQRRLINDSLRIFRFKKRIDSVLAGISADLGRLASQAAPYLLASGQPGAQPFQSEGADILRIRGCYRLHSDVFDYPSEPTPMPTAAEMR